MKGKGKKEKKKKCKEALEFCHELIILILASLLNFCKYMQLDLETDLCSFRWFFFFHFSFFFPHFLQAPSITYEQFTLLVSIEKRNRNLHNIGKYTKHVPNLLNLLFQVLGRRLSIYFCFLKNRKYVSKYLLVKWWCDE